MVIDSRSPTHAFGDKHRGNGWEKTGMTERAKGWGYGFFRKHVLSERPFHAMVRVTGLKRQSFKDSKESLSIF